MGHVTKYGIKDMDLYRENLDRKWGAGTADFLYKLSQTMEPWETKELEQLRSAARMGYWIANGKAQLQLPEVLKFRSERFQGSSRNDQWEKNEQAVIKIKSGWAVSTWIGLGIKLSDLEYGSIRENKEFGSLAIRITGRTEEVIIPI